MQVVDIQNLLIYLLVQFISDFPEIGVVLIDILHLLSENMSETRESFLLLNFDFLNFQWNYQLGNSDYFKEFFQVFFLLCNLLLVLVYFIGVALISLFGLVFVNLLQKYQFFIFEFLKTFLPLVQVVDNLLQTQHLLNYHQIGSSYLSPNFQFTALLLFKSPVFC